MRNFFLAAARLPKAPKLRPRIGLSSWASSHLIHAHGITDAAFTLGRHPIRLTRWRDGIDDIPPDVAERLQEWESDVLGRRRDRQPAVDDF